MNILVDGDFGNFNRMNNKKKNVLQHAIKNIGQKVLNWNIKFINEKSWKYENICFEMPYVSYCQPLGTSLKKKTTSHENITNGELIHQMLYL